MMSPEASRAFAQLREKAIAYHQARMEYLRSMQELEQHIHRETAMPALLRPQAG